MREFVGSHGHGALSKARRGKTTDDKGQKAEDRGRKSEDKRHPPSPRLRPQRPFQPPTAPHPAIDAPDSFSSRKDTTTCGRLVLKVEYVNFKQNSEDFRS